MEACRTSIVEPEYCKVHNRAVEKCQKMWHRSEYTGAFLPETTREAHCVTWEEKNGEVQEVYFWYRPTQKQWMMKSIITQEVFHSQFGGN